MGDGRRMWVCYLNNEYEYVERTRMKKKTDRRNIEVM